MSTSYCDLIFDFDFAFAFAFDFDVDRYINNTSPSDGQG
jgi:hypothetical protein